MTHAGGLQIQFSCGSLAVEMAMEMESYLVGPKKRWRTLLSNAIPKYTLPTPIRSTLGLRTVKTREIRKPGTNRDPSNVIPAPPDHPTLKWHQPPEPRILCWRYWIVRMIAPRPGFSTTTMHSLEPIIVLDNSGHTGISYSPQEETSA